MESTKCFLRIDLECIMNASSLYCPKDLLYFNSIRTYAYKIVGASWLGIAENRSSVVYIRLDSLTVSRPQTRGREGYCMYAVILV